MAQWDIPHDEQHRFLRWGPRDDVFTSWCRFFDAKGVPYEIGGGGTPGKPIAGVQPVQNWTIYKHQLFTNCDEEQVSRCCPMCDDL